MTVKRIVIAILVAISVLPLSGRAALAEIGLWVGFKELPAADPRKILETQLMGLIGNAFGQGAAVQLVACVTDGMNGAKKIGIAASPIPNGVLLAGKANGRGFNVIIDCGMYLKNVVHFTVIVDGRNTGNVAAEVGEVISNNMYIK